MLKVTPSRLNLFRCFFNESVKRYFLSDSYKCEEAWKKRLRNSVFQKIQPANLYHGLDISFQKKISVSVLDVDLLLSSNLDSSFKNEVEDVLLQTRLTPESVILPERATHAAIRWFIENSSAEELLNALSDRLNYGLFPDYYLTNYLMDKYIKENDPVTAVKIAVLQMLQEDFDNPIMKALALYCCYNYLESPLIWPSFKEPEPDPDEEVKKIRVRLARNPYFDDHFDIMDTNHLVGKTLWLFGRTVDGAIGTSSELVGLVLYEKYDKCTEFLHSIIKDNKKLHKDAVEKARNYIIKRPKQVEEEKAEDGKAEGSEEKSKGEVKEVLDEGKTKVLELLEKVRKMKLESETLLSASAELVKKEVKENESNEIKHQCKIYQQWEDEREKHIQEEIERAKLENVKSEIKKIKDQLEEEEERLFFFDREEDIQFQAEEKEKKRQSLKFYKGKSKEEVEEEYIPPNINQRQ